MFTALIDKQEALPAIDHRGLTAEQVQFFDEQGYLSVESLTCPEEIFQIRNIIQNLFDRRAGEKEGAYGELIDGEQNATVNSPQLLNPVNYAPQLHKTNCFANALKIAKTLLGPDARFFLDLSILKTPKTGAATPWHQDAAFRDPSFDYREIAIWVPLQQVGVESGCLQFIPGSHKGPILTHHPMNNDLSSQALECTPSLDGAGVACPLPVGGCSIHQPRTLHCAGPNVSDAPRLAYIMVFGLPPRPASAPQIFPWLDQRETTTQKRKRKWMRKGGALITAWRRIRRGDLSNWQSALFWIRRSARTLRRGA
jgi:ectoine hydroxylase-related dioxygenase (phytanoyl-CoA dioxygenase family)